MVKGVKSFMTIFSYSNQTLPLVVHVLCPPFFRGFAVVNSLQFIVLFCVLPCNGGLSRAQINLKVKICKDSSVRKALVREARLFGASKLVLGLAKKRRAIS